MFRTSYLRAAVVGAIAAAAAYPAVALDYPKKPITIVLPVAPGGGTDTVVRIVSEKLSGALGQQIVVDNRPGASGNIAGEIVAKSAPDGYTLLAVTASHATNPSLYKNMTYDPLKDLTPITQLTSQPYLLVVPNNVPAKSLTEFIEYAKKKDGGITYASSGSGLLGHLGMELLRVQGGFEAVHVPYKGAGPALVDTMAGRVDAFFPTIVSGQPQVAGGKLVPLGVTSLQRSAVIPEVPTIAEQGFPGFEVSGWYGLLAPAGTPKEIVQHLQAEIKKVLALPDVRKRIENDGAEPVASTPQEFEAYIASEAKKWAEVVKASGATAD